MATTHNERYMTVDEYLAFEEKAKTRHEYVDGYLFAMTGVRRVHNIIAGNVYSILRAALRGSPCRVYISEVKVRVRKCNSFYYPDVMVSCDSYDSESVYTESPCLIFEVLSPSTTSIDRREKLIAYRQLDSLKEYIIVHQRRKRLELHRKNASGIWQTEILGHSDELRLLSLPIGAVAMSVASIYEDVDIPETQVREGETAYGQLEDEYSCEEDEELVW